MNAQDLLARLQDASPDGPLDRLASLVVEHELSQPVEALFPPALVARALLLGGSLHMAMGAMMFVFAVAMCFVAGVNHRSLSEALSASKQAAGTYTSQRDQRVAQLQSQLQRLEAIQKEMPALPPMRQKAVQR